MRRSGPNTAYERRDIQRSKKKSRAGPRGGSLYIMSRLLAFGSHSRCLVSVRSVLSLNAGLFSIADRRHPLLNEGSQKLTLSSFILPLASKGAIKPSVIIA